MPKINKSCELKRGPPVFVRLNSEHKLQKERLNRKRIENFKKTNLNKIISRNKLSKSFTLIASNTFDKLFKDGDKYRENRIKLSERIYKSVTFRPKTNTDVSTIKISSTFEERNKKLVELKNEFINKLQLQENEELEKEKIKKKTLSKKEIERNNKIIVERLYNKEMEKIREKNKELNYQSNFEKLKKEHNIRFKNDDENKKKGTIQDYVQLKSEKKDDLNKIQSNSDIISTDIHNSNEGNKNETLLNYPQRKSEKKIDLNSIQSNEDITSTKINNSNDDGCIKKSVIQDYIKRKSENNYNLNTNKSNRDINSEELKISCIDDEFDKEKIQYIQRKSGNNIKSDLNSNNRQFNSNNINHSNFVDENKKEILQNYIPRKSEKNYNLNTIQTNTDYSRDNKNSSNLITRKSKSRSIIQENIQENSNTAFISLKKKDIISAPSSEKNFRSKALMNIIKTRIEPINKRESVSKSERINN